MSKKDSKTSIEYETGLEQFDHGFTQAATSGFGLAYEAAALAIETGKLDAEYRLGDISAFSGRLALVEPYYKRLIQITEEYPSIDFAPALTFYPRGLKIGQLSTLLAGYKLDEGGRAKGLRCRWNKHVTDPDQILEDSYNGELNKGWDVAVTCNSAKPTLTRISGDGGLGPAAEKIKAILKQFAGNWQEPDESGGTPAIHKHDKRLVKVFSPTVPIYTAMQWAGIINGRPIDSERPENMTYLRERVSIAQGKRMAVGFFDKEKKIISVGTRKLNATSGSKHAGIRPTISAEDIHS